MTRDSLDRVTQVLRSSVAEPGDVGQMPSGRDEAIAKLGEALGVRSRARSRRRALGFMVAAAAVITVSWGAVSALSRGESGRAAELGRVSGPASSVTAVRDGHVEALNAGARVAEGTELRTPSGAAAHLEFDTGTLVTIGSAARVRVVEQTKSKRFAVEAGSLHAKVAKLGTNERFVVTTPDAEIEVRGTSFRVAVVAPDATCANGSPTRVEVVEGTVVVRHDGVVTDVTAGDRWPACASVPATTIGGAPPPPAPTPPPVHTAVVVPRLETTAEKTASTPAPPSATKTPGESAPTGGTASTQLSKQNDLFDAAMRDKRAGRTGGALTTLDRLLASYPRGPLAESASVERMRLLAATDRPRAAAAAREYLARWPRGFARAEAESIAAGGP